MKVLEVALGPVVMKVLEVLDINISLVLQKKTSNTRTRLVCSKLNTSTTNTPSRLGYQCWVGVKYILYTPPVWFRFETVDTL
jgi:hypothetical protein